MSTTEETLDSLAGDSQVMLALALEEAEALRAWLLKPAADGATSLDDPLLNGILTRLGRAVDLVHATVNIRLELERVGLDLAHLSDDQVRELGRRVSEASAPGLRG